MKQLLLFLGCMTFICTSQAQRGKNGPVTITSANWIVNEYTRLTANAAPGEMLITVANSNLNENGRYQSSLAAGDLLMIIQMQGATLQGTLVGNNGVPNDSTWGSIISYNNCGNYEFAEVLGVPNATTISLRCGLQYSYSASGNVQVIRVPRYTALTINNGGVITCDPWNGSTGGICAVEAENNIIINAAGGFNVSGKGFRGGVLIENLSGFGVDQVASINESDGAEKGESIGGYQADYDPMGGRYGKGAPANGGGGGNGSRAGGGGGANGGMVNTWNGHGVADLSGPDFSTAFDLEYPWKSTVASSGGGKGGYTYSSSNQNATVTGPTLSSSQLVITWGGDYRRNNGGFGGRPLDYSTGRLFLGGGGGAGDQNHNNGGRGGNGGGMLYIMCYGPVSGTGSVMANGDNGIHATGVPSMNSYAGQDGAGGGGAGGTIILNAVGAITGITAHANGGNGGDQVLVKGSSFFGAMNEAEGPGGGGGGGYIAVSNGGITTTATGGHNGTTNSEGLTEFPPNGATKGANGTTSQPVTNFTITAGNTTICAGSTATLSATLNGTVPAGTVVTWYSAATGGTLLATGATFITPVLHTTTTYYAGTCPGTYTVPVTVDVNPAIVIAKQPPASLSLCTGNIIHLAVAASDATAYLWRKNGTPLTNGGNMSGADTDTLLISNISTTDTGNYDVVITGKTGCTPDTSTRSTVAIGVMNMNLSGTATDTAHHADGATITYADSLCNLMAKIEESAGGNVLGQVSMSVTLAPSVPTINGQPYLQRHYAISAANDGHATITLYASQADFDAYNVVASSTGYPLLPTGGTNNGNVKVTKFTGNTIGTGTATLITPTTVLWNNIASCWEIRFSVATSGLFFIHSGSYPLETNLLSFTVTPVGNQNNVRWKTANEGDLQYYEVEHSSDARQYVRLATIVAQHRTEGYSYVHDNPGIGYSYYRLKLTTANGDVRYSHVVQTGSYLGNADIQAYPNPAYDRIMIRMRGTITRDASLQLLDDTGKIVRFISVAGNEAVIRLQGLAPGVYLLKYLNNGEIAMLKVIVR